MAMSGKLFAYNMEFLNNLLNNQNEKDMKMSFSNVQALKFLCYFLSIAAEVEHKL